LNKIKGETKIIDNSIKVYNYKCVCPFCDKAILKEDYERENGL